MLYLCRQLHNRNLTVDVFFNFPLFLYPDRMIGLCCCRGGHSVLQTHVDCFFYYDKYRTKIHNLMHIIMCVLNHMRRVMTKGP